MVVLLPPREEVSIDVVESLLTGNIKEITKQKCKKGEQIKVNGTLESSWMCSYIGHEPFI